MNLILLFLTVLSLSLTSCQYTVRDVVEDFPHDQWTDEEGTSSSQFALVEKQTAALLPQRPGIIDLYFVGFGSDANQDVFMNEVLYAKRLFDQRFDTQGRSVALINNRTTAKELPLASFTNLRATLRDISRLLNPEEDILFLFLTSHGSRNHILTVNYQPWPLRQVSPSELATALAESGMKWRVVVISACYSGGFIDKLKNDYTLIITAAAANRPSFGCDAEAELTYFGKAFFQDQLTREVRFLHAFEGARALIQQREAEGKVEASNPQVSAPPAIVEKLKALEARLRVQ
ncbi:MAG: C13 family peptidase [Candidatus Binatia bacterium]